MNPTARKLTALSLAAVMGLGLAAYLLRNAELPADLYK